MTRAEELQKAIAKRREALAGANIQCPSCLHWVEKYRYSLAQDLCDSCIEDLSAEEMEHWLRSDYNSSRGV